MINILNTILLHGCFVDDPVMGETPAGVRYANFALAVDRDYRGADGRKVADFFDCTAWRSDAEFIGKYFRKGQEAVIKGNMESRKWVDKDGKKRVSWNVIVNTIDFAGGRKDYQGEPKMEAPEQVEAEVFDQLS